MFSTVLLSSELAPILAVFLTLSPIPTLLSLPKWNPSEISPINNLPLLPYTSMIVNGTCWTLYGLLVSAPPIYIANSIGIFLGLIYLNVFIYKSGGFNRLDSGGVGLNLSVSDELRRREDDAFCIDDDEDDEDDNTTPPPPTTTSSTNEVKTDDTTRIYNHPQPIPLRKRNDLPFTLTSQILTSSIIITVAFFLFINNDDNSITGLAVLSNIVCSVLFASPLSSIVRIFRKGVCLNGEIPLPFTACQFLNCFGKMIIGLLLSYAFCLS